MKDNKKILPVIIIAGVILIGAAFFGGMKYANSKSPVNGFAGANGQRFGQGAIGANGARRAGAQNGGTVTGDFVSKDDKSVTVQLRGGGSKIVFFTPKTTVMKSVTGTIADLSSGEGLLVLGTANSDGSVNAESIQIRPAFTTSSLPVKP